MNASGLLYDRIEQQTYSLKRNMKEVHAMSICLEAVKSGDKNSILVYNKYKCTFTTYVISKHLNMYSPKNINHIFIQYLK